MSEERSKITLSLRSGKRRKARPVISAPRQISAPILQDGSTGGTAAGPGALVPLPEAPRPRPALVSGKVRYHDTAAEEICLDQATNLGCVDL
jgi:hypothetical protein